MLESPAGLALSETEIVALHLIHERRIMGKASLWAPWLAVQPSTFSTTMYWDEEELALLQGSNLLGVTTTFVDNLKRDYEQRIKPAVAKFAHLWTPSAAAAAAKAAAIAAAGAVDDGSAAKVSFSSASDAGDDIHGTNTLDVSDESSSAGQSLRTAETAADGVVTWEEMKWGLNMVFSRAFDVQWKGEVRRILVPFADMFNYAEGGQLAGFFVDRATDSFMLTTSGSGVVPSGRQMYVNYGSFNSLRSNDDLLHQYGFVLDPNPFSTVKVNLYLGQQGGKPEDWDLKNHILTRSNLKVGREQSYIIKANHHNRLESDLLLAMRILLLDGEEEMALFGKALAGKSVSSRNDRQVYQTLVAAFQAMLDAYPDEIDEDEETLSAVKEKRTMAWQEHQNSIKGVTDTEGHSGTVQISGSLQRLENNYNALVVRLGEKKILLSHIEMLEDKLSTLS